MEVCETGSSWDQHFGSSMGVRLGDSARARVQHKGSVSGTAHCQHAGSTTNIVPLY
jgi:hypothetical protein